MRDARCAIRNNYSSMFGVPMTKAITLPVLSCTSHESANRESSYKSDISCHDFSYEALIGSPPLRDRLTCSHSSGSYPLR